MSLSRMLDREFIASNSVKEDTADMMQKIKIKKNTNNTIRE